MSKRRCIVVNTYDEMNILAQQSLEPDTTILVVGGNAYGSRFDVIDYTRVHFYELSKVQQERYREWQYGMRYRLARNGKVIEEVSDE